MVSGADVPLGHHHACSVHFQHDYGMGIIAYPQDIPDLYVLKCKSALCVHPCRQIAECRVAEYKGKGYAAHGTNIVPIKGTALPFIVAR